MSFSTLRQLPDQSHPDAAHYANQMAEIRERLGIVTKTVEQVKAAGKEDVVSIEVIFIQLRKCTELIAFGSLLANREVYSQHHKEFATDWRLKRMVERLKKLNPDFYPVPVSEPVSTESGQFSIEPATEPYLTEDELVSLYDISGQILHTRNPFSTANSVHQLGHSIGDWVKRIKALLRWHYIQQTQASRWLVEIPTTGVVHVYPSSMLVE